MIIRFSSQLSMVGCLLFFGLCIYLCNAIAGDNDLKAPEVSISTSQSVLESLQNVFTNIEEQFHKIVAKISLNLPDIIRDTEKLIAKIARRLVGTFIAIGNVFEDVLLKVNDVQSEFGNFSVDVEEKFAWAVTYLNQTLMNNSESIDLWAGKVKEQLRSANDTRLYQKGCQVVDEFIRNRAAELRRCCNITIKPMESLCHRARNVMARTLAILAGVLENIQMCLEDKNSYTTYMAPCLEMAYSELIVLTERVQQLRQNIDTIFPIKIFHSKRCIALVLVEMEQQQSRFEGDFIGRRN